MAANSFPSQSQSTGFQFFSLKNASLQLLISFGFYNAFLLSSLNAQETKSSDTRAAQPGHSLHADAFNEGPRQAAYLMSGMGNVLWPISTKNAMAQRFFDQGIVQLHGFWYFEAERSFRQAAAFDPNCAILYWGAARANIENTKRSRGFIKQATDRTSNASDKEKQLIQAWSDRVALIDGEESEVADATDSKASKKTPTQKRAEKRTAEKRKKIEKERLAAYVKSIERIAYDYPDDVELKAMLVLQYWQNDGKGEKLQSHFAINALLNDILRANPRHPAHHFRIHLWDYRKENLAIDGAAKCGPSAPGIAHMWHMPGHTYARLHRFADAAWQQEASARVDHAHMIRDRIMPDQIHNFAHNNEWLIRNFILLGRVDEAIELAKNMIELPRHPKYNKIDGRGSASLGRERLLNVLTSYRLWAELIELADSAYLEPTNDELKQDERNAWLAIAHANVNEPTKSTEHLSQLLDSKKILQSELATKQAQLDVLIAKENKTDNQRRRPPKLVQPYEPKDPLFGDENDPFLPKLPSKELSDDESKDWSEDRLKTASEHREIEYRLAKMKQYESAIAAHSEAAKGDFAAALRYSHECRSIVPPILRLQWLAQAGHASQALKKIKSKIEEDPNELISLAVGIWIASQTDLSIEGNSKIASDWIKLLSPIAHRADSGHRMTMLNRIEATVEKLELAKQWRTAGIVPDDIGDRPELDSLGPFRWSPASAPSWMAASPDGGWRTSKEFAGKPQVLIFYLGAGCLHCTEQLKAFAPKASEFLDAGIEIIAISSESVPQLKRGISNADWSVPFPLLANPEFDVFKEYRCFDDFEGAPLHGTFLIDSKGKIRWQDIGYEPFMSPEFLLEESKRLLKL